MNGRQEYLTDLHADRSVCHVGGCPKREVSR